MNVTHMALRNFKSWGEIEIAIPAGTSLLAGANGAGKSSLVEAMLVAMYGSSSDAGSYIRRGTDAASVTVEIATGSGDLMITRTIRASGASAKVGLQAWLDGESITCATVTETQSAIDRLLGVSREVLLASAFSTQHAGGAFTEARPADRKRILTETLPDLAIWAPLYEIVKQRKRDAEERVAGENLVITQLQGDDGSTAEVRHGIAVDALWIAIEHRTAMVEAETEAETTASRLSAEAEAAREARRAHATAVEAEQRATADHQRAGMERERANEALARAKAAAANAPSVEDAQAIAFDAGLHLAEAELQMGDAETEQRRSAEHARVERQKLADAEREQREAIQSIHDLQGRLETADAGTCGECGQPLVSEEAKELRGRLLSALNQAQRVGILADEDVALRRHRAADAERRVTGDDYIDQVRSALNEARGGAEAARRKLAEAQTIQSLAGSIDTAQQRARDAADRQAETAEMLRSISAGVIAANSVPINVRAYEEHAAAVEALATARAAHSAAAAELARAEEAAKLAERQAADETAARERLEVATRDAAVASVLCNGFGPRGVPAMVVDSTLGDLSDEANRVLAELGSPIRCELRSQRVTQKGDLVDTLEIIVTMGGLEAAYETLSGGERTRVALALRAALTRLLASKRGARVRLLVADEPSGLDANGADAFADVLGEFVRAGIFESCIVVTHDERLADRIDRVIRVEKSPDGVSRLVGASVEVPA